jgi:hypothetical protein
MNFNIKKNLILGVFEAKITRGATLSMQKKFNTGTLLLLLHASAQGQQDDTQT